jgi:glycine oxidase
MMNRKPPLASESVWFATLSPAERGHLDCLRGEITHSRPDVLVVGGGLVGLAIAYYLADRGAKVQVIEGNTLASGASGANAGGIWPNDQGPLHSAGFQTLAFLSRDLWGRLSLRPDFDFDWRVNGLLNVNAGRIGPSATSTAKRLQDQGYAVQDVDAEQIAELEPALRSGLSYGLHLPSEAHLHPVKAAVSLVRALRRRGVGMSVGVVASRLLMHGEKIKGVETTAGSIEAQHVVAATGWSAAWLGTAMSPLPPLRPVSGQLISTPPLPPLLRGTVAGEFLVFQLRSGEVVTGPDVVESDRLVPDPALSLQFADAARDLIPALRDVAFDRAWCGIRPGTPDGLPVIDRAANAENLWLACGHFRNGVLLAPGTGKLLADWIVRKTQPEELIPFAASRFTADGSVPFRA